MLIPSLLLCVERGVSYSNISMQYKVLAEYFNFCIIKIEMFIVITYSTRYMYTRIRVGYFTDTLPVD